MGKTLIITEKPSVAQEYASVLHVAGRKNGYMENDEYIITWCVGHLIAMSYPEKYDERYKKWTMEDLPFLPREYRYEPIPAVSGQFKTVKSQLNRKDVSLILYAGDPAREGIYIQYLVRQMAGHNQSAEERCVWIDSQTEEEIKRGIREARELSRYDSLADAGYMRAIEDYAVGINFSRALTIKYGSLVNRMAGREGKERQPLSVGRVMICVLGMAVRREREIRNFRETPFHKIQGTFRNPSGGGLIQAEWKAVEGSKHYGSPALYSEKGFRERITAEEHACTMKGIQKAVIEDVRRQEEKKQPPLLFNLAELQAECAKRLKISPDKTLETMQSLYEKKLTTYPRTDARVLSSAAAKEIHKNVEGLERYQPLKAYAGNITYNHLYDGIENTRYVDDSRVSDHYAVIPTGRTEGIETLDEQEKKVYDLIARRFLGIFYPPAAYEKTSVSIRVKGEAFESSQKTLSSRGYLEVLECTEGDTDMQTQEGDQGLAQAAKGLKKGDSISIMDMQVKEGKTTPPKRYTSGSIILAMENAGQLIEDEEKREQMKGKGIGTSATRAEILKKLQKIGYLAIHEKTQAITPKPFGEMVYETVSMTVPDMLVPDLTAAWEQELEKVAAGQLDREAFLQHMGSYVTQAVRDIQTQDMGTRLQEAVKPFAVQMPKKDMPKEAGTCPECGRVLYERQGKYGRFISCSGYPECRYMPKKEEPEPEKVGTCPECGKALVKRRGKYGEFISCSGYPKCRYYPKRKHS